MSFLMNLILLGGLSVIGYALYRKFKKKDLDGKPLHKLMTIGAAMVIMGLIFSPAGGGGGASIDDVKNVELGWREDTSYFPSPASITLGDVCKAMADSGELTVERDGNKITFNWQGERGCVVADFEILNVRGIGVMAVVTDAALKNAMGGDPKVAGSAEAYVALSGLVKGN